VCKKSIKNSQPFVKKIKKSGPLRGGFFSTHTVDVQQCLGFIARTHAKL